jgi:autotransporter translocation and assembly factor TamB
MRRAVRWILRIVIAMVTLVAIAVIAVVIALHTDWGRNWMRGRVETALAKRFPGGVHLGRVEGSVFGEVIVHDIEIDGSDHQPKLTIGTARIKIALLPLLSKTAHFDELVIEDVLVVRDPPSPAGDPSTWIIEMPDFELHRGRITGTFEAHEIAVAGSIRVVPDGETTAAITGGASWQDQRITWTAVVRQSGTSLALPFVLVQGAGAHVTILGGRVEPAAVVGQIDVALPMVAAKRLAGIETIHDSRLMIDARSNGFVEVRALWGVHEVHALLNPDIATSTARGLLAGQVADVSMFAGSLASGPAFIVGALDIERGRIRGIVSIDGPVTAAIALDTSLSHGTVIVGGSNRNGNVAAFAELTRADHQITIDRSRVLARATSIRGVTGALRADLEATGRVWPPRDGDLRVSGIVGGKHVRYAKAGVAAASVELRVLEVRRLFDQTSGQVRLDVVGASRAGVPLGSGTIGTHFVLANTSGFTKLALGSHMARLRDGSVWRGSGGLLTLDGDRITLSRLRTSRGNGQLTADASFAPPTGNFTAKIDAHGVKALDGHVDGSVSLARRGGRWSGSGKLHGDALVVDVHRPPIDADADLQIAGRRITVHGSGTSTNGSITLAADFDGPRDLTDPLAWRRLDRRSIRELAVGVAKFDTGHGMLDGELSLGATDAHGKLAIRGVSVGRFTLDADLTVAQAPRGELAVTGIARDGDLGLATGEAHVALPLHLFDPKEWRTLGAAMFRDGTVRVDDFGFDPILLARFGITAPYRGRLGATATISAGATTATVVADLHQLQGGPIVKPIYVHVQGGVDGAGVHLASTATVDNKIFLELTGRSPISLDRLRPDLLRAAPITATLAIPAVSGHDVLAIFGRSNVVDGTVTAVAEVTGTFAHPKGHATVTARDVTVAAGVTGRAPTTLRDLTADARWDGSTVAIIADGHETSGGSLHLSATAHPEDWGTLVASIEATKFDLAPLAAFAPGPLAGAAGILDAHLALRGDPSTGDAHGDLHLDQARIPLTPKIGTMRNVDADLAIADHRVTVTWSGLLGDGDVKGKGTVVLDGTLPRSAEATLALHHISPIGGYEPVIDADLSARIARDGRHWKGHVDVRNGHIAVSTNKADALFETAAPDDMTFVHELAQPKNTAPPPPPSDPILTLDIDLGPTIVEADLGAKLLDSDSMRTSISGQVQVTAAKGELGMDGEIDAESGVAVMFGRRYQIDHASIRFDGTVDPWLDLRLVHDFPDLTLTASITGRASNPDLALSSDPSKYTQGQMLGFLLGGAPGGDPGSETRDVAFGGASSAVSGRIAKEINKLSPVKVDTFGYEAATSSSSAAFRVGKWLSAKLFIAYRQHLNAQPNENGGEGDAEYYLRQNVLIQGTAGDRGYDGVDLLWRKRW